MTEALLDDHVCNPSHKSAPPRLSGRIPIESQICDAIRQRQVISFTYKMKVRIVEPHFIGYDRAGNLMLNAWETSGAEPGWRDFPVAKVSALAATGAIFPGARPSYNRQDGTLARVICRL